MITVAAGTPDDFHDANAFVAAAIRDAFYRPDLTPEQVAENERIVGVAERTACEAVDHPHRAVFVAKDGGILAGFVIVDRSPASGRPGDRGDAAMPEIDWLIVAPDYQGKGVAGRLMEQALDWIGAGVPVQLGVIHFNARAIAFYKKWGFADTGRIVGRHKIPRRLMVRAVTSASMA
ncbi:GNAT family N-acetyltransferase [Dongia sedimenti]|uniref:GNAT family N-acetyltransferase n=1 Tax=Dongia sedimenti TaxID=3064282 RepID=A0ABU0YUI8_9PROT|nr:GNAT family N-acetyltransferase [Rhodospirillaceae bacterium R-7]